MIKTIIADDHGLIRQGLKGVFSTSKFQIVGEAADGEEAFSLIRKLHPKIAVLDLFMPKLSGIEVLKKVKEAELDTSILIISASSHADDVVNAYANGAAGYIFKGSNETLVISAAEKIARGEVFYSRLAMDILIKSGYSNTSQISSTELTGREQEILKALVSGKTNKEIAAEFYLSTRTIDAHRRNIMTKLNVSNSAQLVRVAIEKKLV